MILPIRKSIMPPIPMAPIASLWAATITRPRTSNASPATGIVDRSKLSADSNQDTEKFEYQSVNANVRCCTNAKCPCTDA